MASPSKWHYSESQEAKSHLPPLYFRNEVYESMTSLGSQHSLFTHPVSSSMQDSQKCLNTSVTSLLPGDRKRDRKHTEKNIMGKVHKSCISDLVKSSDKRNQEFCQLANQSKEHDDYGSVLKTTKAMQIHNQQGEHNKKENRLVDDFKLSLKDQGPRLQYLKKLRIHTYGSVISLALSFMCFYTSFLSLKSLQSTVHSSWNGIGVTSLSCIYAAGVLSCLVAPAIINIFGYKYTMSSSMLLFLVYIGCNMLPEENLYFLIPASLLIGCSLGMLWTSACAFITCSVSFYACAIKSSKFEELLCKFNGIFYTVFSMAHFWAHLISGAVLNARRKLPSQTLRSVSTISSLSSEALANDSTSEDLVNVTRSSDSLASSLPSQSLTCGGYSEVQTSLFEEKTQLYTSPVDAHHSLVKNDNHNFVPYKAWFLLCSVYIILVVLSVMILLLFLRKRPELPVLESDDRKHISSQDSITKENLKHKDRGNIRLVTTISLLKDPRLQLLLPLIVFTALKESFVYSDYTQVSINIHAFSILLLP